MKHKYLLITLLFLLFACSSKIDTSTYNEAQKVGNEITARAKTTLLKNVGGAIQKGGPQYAVEYCNLEANTIIEGLNREFNCTISRVSDKNRNPKAGLTSEIEKQLWAIFADGNLVDTIVGTTNKLVFYKPITIALPACLKCHGDFGQEINSATQQKLQELYPKDLATGYQLNDFRGLWKIEFEKRQ